MDFSVLHKSAIGNFYKFVFPGGSMRYYVSGFYERCTFFCDDKGYNNREDGPAIIYANGDVEWCLGGMLFTKENFDHEIKKKKELAEAKAKVDPCDGKIVDIDGKKYKLVFQPDK